MKSTSVICPICNWVGDEFYHLDYGFGHIYYNSTCPNCYSRPRQRLFFFYLKKVLPRNKIINVLHFAPEKSLTHLFKSYSNINYLSVDIDSRKAMKQEDITNLSFKDNSFDFIFCSHVLEHVEKDKKAMMEMYRVLKLNGFAIIDVPIDYSREKTYEDSSILTPEDRTNAFWQFDQVRLYGNDFRDKLENVGFIVKISEVKSIFKKNIIEKFGMQKTPIYSCFKN